MEEEKYTVLDFSSGGRYQSINDRADYTILGVEVSFKNLVYEVKTKVDGKKVDKQILKEVSGILKRGTVTAIMGASGSGKTSLLDSLAGRKEVGLSGEILVNGTPRNSGFKRISGYVVQDDVVMGTLTVKENLMFSAQLRLPESMTVKEKAIKVAEVISQLGLDKVADSLVGTEMIRGVSGGERKRVNVGMELITAPGILFLDEPTTGLDATTAVDVVTILKNLSMSGQTIVLSVHQPRYSIFKLFDDLILMSEGEMAYAGRATDAIDYFKAFGFECEQFNNPADFFLDILNEEVKKITSGQEVKERFSEKFKGSSFYKKMILDVEKAHSKDSSKNEPLEMDLESYETSFAHQLKIISKRTVLNILRNPAVTILQMSVNVIFALIVGAIYFNVDNTQTGVQNRTGAFFFIIMNMIFGNLSAIELFLAERKIFVHEKANGYYRPISYFLSKVLCDLVPMRIIPTFIFGSIVYFMIGFQGDANHFFIFQLILGLTANCAAALCFAASSFVSMASIANLIVALAYVFFMLFAGLLINLDNIPVYFRWLEYLSIFKYSLRLKY